MEFRILTKEYVLNNGLDFGDDDILCWEDYSDRILDKSKEGEGQPFTGLTYETYPNGNLVYYCYYKDGFSDGDFIEFYDNGKIKSMCTMLRGRVYGISKEWHANGVLKSEEKCEYGVCLTYKEWDEEGNLIKEKLGPSESDLKLRAAGERFHRIATGKGDEGDRIKLSSLSKWKHKVLLLFRKRS